MGRVDLVGPLPVDEVLPQLREALRTRGVAVLVAPPGAGKTTRVPLDLLAHEVVTGRTVVLEPRRLAARGAAHRLAAQLGEPVGERVGLTTRDERRTSARTRIEIVTDGVLLRRLQRDPGLDGVGLLLFDEFHERRLESDLALAFAIEARETVRDDLQLLVTSATLDPVAVSRLLGEAPTITAQGRAHPVELSWCGEVGPGGLTAATVDGIGRAVAPDDGDVLVFLPGVREIAAVEGVLPTRLHGVRLDVRRLHGGLSPAAQDRALAPAPPGHRRVILSTDVAETSVTVPGIVAVVDAGLSREPRTDPRSGLSGLVTVPASRSSADQRAGRAGRLGPGRCLRLWSSAGHATRPAATTPAIATDDLTAAALEVACWGTDVAELALLDPPDARAWAAASATLRQLGAVDDTGRPTAHGRALARLPLHPRSAHLVLLGAARGYGRLACEVAALLADRDPLRPARERPDADLATRVRVLRGGAPPPGATVDDATLRRVRREVTRLSRLLDRLPGLAAAASPRTASGRADDVAATGALVLAAWPDRLAAVRARAADVEGRAQVRTAAGELVLASGRGARLPASDPLATGPLLAVASVDHGFGPTRRDGTSEARVHLAAAVDVDTVREVLPLEPRDADSATDGDPPTGRRVEDAAVRWEDGEVRATVRERVGAIVLREQPWDGAPAQARVRALLDGLRQEGLELLGWSRDDRQLQARLQLLHRTSGDPWLACDDASLLADLETRVAPFLTGARRRRDLARVAVGPLLLAGGPPTARADVDRLAPTHLPVPSGRHARLDYDPHGGRPVLAVKLQELFGATTTPAVVDGRVPVVLHLLSPAGRPVQVTDDLPSFWERGYHEVRAELRGRYPKHPWPQDPTAATATRRTTRPSRRAR